MPRQKRYRRRFLTLARSLRPVLREVAEQHRLPLDEDPVRLPWVILSRGLCLKSVSESRAGPRGNRRAILSAKRIFRRAGTMNPRLGA